MRDFAGLTIIPDACGEALGQGELVVDNLQEDCTTIGATVGLVEIDGYGPVKIFAKENRLCGIVSHQKASVCARYLSGIKYLYVDGGFLFLRFANNQG